MELTRRHGHENDFTPNKMDIPKPTSTIMKIAYLHNIYE